LTESRFGATLQHVTDAATVLRQHGLNVTAQRLAVMRVVADRPHVSADAVADQVRTELGTVSRQAVYDALATLSQKGIIRRIEPAGSPARYESRVGDNHHHLVCRSCGRLEDVDCALGEVPCLIPVDDRSFVVDEAEVIYWGTCPDCQEPEHP
jgi:Fur family ferric uptake transcriptional regulator